MSGLTPERTEKVFPWAGFVLGSVSLIGLVGIFVGAIIYVFITGEENVPGILNFTEGIVINFAILG